MVRFNPRTHEGCDSLASTGGYPAYVSIHAPTRGATFIKDMVDDSDQFQSTHPRGVRRKLLHRLYDATGFNPRTHEGCDRIVYHLGTLSSVSIHAPTRGATVVEVPQFGSIQSFNPRTHEGCDFKAFFIKPTRYVSIHAPTRGATAYSAKYRILIYKSSHFANINQTITFKVIKSLEFL